MIPERQARILTLFDAGETPVAISNALALPKGTVWAVLRAYRPQRKRAPRRRVSGVPDQVRALHGAGVGVARIAALLGVSRAYAYKILQDSTVTTGDRA